MAPIAFGRHFSLLALASVILLALFQWQAQLVSEYPFALFGVFHALAVLGALRAPRPLLESALFVVAGGVLSTGAMYFGIFAMGLTVPIAFTVASIFGAITYGAVIRLLWLPHLPLRALAITAGGCGIASLVALFLATNAESRVQVWTLAWWWTFSGLLWSQIARPWRLTMRWSGP